METKFYLPFDRLMSNFLSALSQKRLKLSNNAYCFKLHHLYLFEIHVIRHWTPRPETEYG